MLPLDNNNCKVTYWKQLDIQKPLVLVKEAMDNIRALESLEGRTTEPVIGGAPFVWENSENHFVRQKVKYEYR